MFFPKVIETIHSKVNGQITVYKTFGNFSLSVNNLTQSGGLLVPIWKKSLKRVQKKLPFIRRALILGFGGGTAARLISSFWPSAHIDAVEIDPQMIKLAKKYFAVAFIPNLKIISADVFKPLSKKTGLRYVDYDLILIDVYCGEKFPSLAESQKFLKKINKLLSDPGIAIFNRVNYKLESNNIKKIVSKLTSIFPHVKKQKILSNTLVFCSRKG